MKLLDVQSEIILENSRAILRPLKPSDVVNLKEVALGNPGLMQYSPTPVQTEEDLQEYIHTALRARNSGIRYPFSVFDKDTNQYAGSTSLGNISNKDLRVEIGWTWIGREFQRTGLNRNCKYLLLEYIFEELEFERTELKTDARNRQSRTAIEAIGGIYEGTLRSHTLMSDGHRRDTVYYSILKNEWEDVKRRVFGGFDEN